MTVWGRTVHFSIQAPIVSGAEVTAGWANRKHLMPRAKCLLQHLTAHNDTSQPCRTRIGYVIDQGGEKMFQVKSGTTLSPESSIDWTGSVVLNSNVLYLMAQFVDGITANDQVWFKGTYQVLGGVV